MELLELHVNEVALLLTAAHFPTGTFKEETVDVGALSGEGRVVFRSECVLDLRSEADVIERKVLSTSSYLHDSRQVGHGVEETRDPQDGRSLNVVSPLSELRDTLEELNVPLSKRLLGRVGVTGPPWRKHIDLE